MSKRKRTPERDALLGNYVRCWLSWVKAALHDELLITDIVTSLSRVSERQAAAAY